ncbi:MAG: SDR family NAD(P)-dependent oxidoreductase [Novosphingobium sp.]
MAGRLAGKVAVITGAGSGMGRAMAELFAVEGAKIVCVEISGSGMKE